MYVCRPTYLWIYGQWTGIWHAPSKLKCWIQPWRWYSMWCLKRPTVDVICFVPSCICHGALWTLKVHSHRMRCVAVHCGALWCRTALHRGTTRCLGFCKCVLTCASWCGISRRTTACCEYTLMYPSYISRVTVGNAVCHLIFLLLNAFWAKSGSSAVWICVWEGFMKVKRASYQLVLQL